MHWRDLNASDRLQLAKEIMASLSVEEDTGFLFASKVEPESVSPSMLAYYAQLQGTGLDDGRLAEEAQRELDWRDARRHFFESDLWGEPGWMMLLDLFIQRVRGKGVTITSACIASRIAPTTALRWIKFLEHEDLVVTENCSVDARRRWMRLTPEGLNRIRRYLAARVGNGRRQPPPKLSETNKSRVRRLTPL